MFSPIRHGTSRGAKRVAQSSALPDFLVPSLSSRFHSRLFSTTRPKASRVGAAAVGIPEGVSLTIIEPPKPKDGIVKRVTPLRKIQVKGPSGELNVDLPHYMTLHQDSETKKARLTIEDRTVRKQREMWGTTRAILNNHVMGVSEGHATVLRLNGVGYRAILENAAQTKKPEYEGQQFVSLRVGYSHPVELPVPVGVKVTTPQPTRILLEGNDKETVNQFAAEIRHWRKPEPYKGKGIFVNGETIRLKAKKIK